MNDYPKAMYAADGEEEVWGEKLRVLIVKDEDHELAAIAEGYVTHPHDLKPEPKKLGRPKKEPES